MKGEEPAADVIRVNEIARMKTPELRNVAGKAELKGPETHPLELNSAEPNVVKVGGIQRAGNYKLVHKDKPGMRPHWLAVNPATGESDLTPISAKEQAELFGTANVQRLGFASLQFDRRREIFAFMIALLFIAFIIEAVFGAFQSLRRGAQNE